MRIDHVVGDTAAKQKWLRPDKRQSEALGPVSDKSVTTSTTDTTRNIILSIITIVAFIIVTICIITFILIITFPLAQALLITIFFTTIAVIDFIDIIVRIMVMVMVTIIIIIIIITAIVIIVLIVVIITAILVVMISVAFIIISSSTVILSNLHLTRQAYPQPNELPGQGGVPTRPRSLDRARRPVDSMGLHRRSSSPLLVGIGVVLLWQTWQSQQHVFLAERAQPRLERTGVVPDCQGREKESQLCRRNMFMVLAAGAGQAESAQAASPKTILVAGATGQTGRRIIERLAKMGDVSVIGGVRDTAKAEKELGKSSIAIRGAMVDEVKAVDTKGVSLKPLDVTKDSVDKLAETLVGCNALIIATGFVPSNPFAMGAEAHAVDNLGTKALVDAAKKSGVSKIVLVSSILTNGRAWGQENSPGFQVTNAFGNVLDEKLEAEKYLRASGIDYTIVRPGGLKSAAPETNLLLGIHEFVGKEDTLNSGEVSRDLVADVSIAAVFDGKASNKVVEIIEDDKAKSLSQSEWFVL
ncbi:Uncharacterized protein, chloroplastic [Symbiodinium microadriaticum]|uniref:Uncharacterized protein, chloroplastic n=1 Tax=Symbiodinium microadriaticum TaxID=2951 RepID=A0A1Q9CGZ9_SYMMI|nr:Uncharacterized protein, chloroplastic [Symbiodinium microadriaticum]